MFQIYGMRLIFNQLKNVLKMNLKLFQSMEKRLTEVIAVFDACHKNNGYD